VTHVQGVYEVALAIVLFIGILGGGWVAIGALVQYIDRVVNRFTRARGEK
jgi:hypothetical protein